MQLHNLSISSCVPANHRNLHFPKSPPPQSPLSRFVTFNVLLVFNDSDVKLSQVKNKGLRISTARILGNIGSAQITI